MSIAISIVSYKGQLCSFTNVIVCSDLIRWFWMWVEVPIMQIHLLNFDPSLCRHHGAHERSRRCPEMHQQCWEAWETPGPHQTLLQGHCALPDRHDEARYVDWKRNIRASVIDSVYWIVLCLQPTINVTLGVSPLEWIFHGVHSLLLCSSVQVTLESLRLSTTTEPGKLSSISMAGWTRWDA